MMLITVVLYYRRICALLKYFNLNDDTFSLSRLPQNRLTWGSSENKTINKLCIRGHKSPVTVWTVAYVYRLYMFEPDGSLKKKVSAAVIPLTDHALQAGFNLLTSFSMPQERQCLSLTLLLYLLMRGPLCS